MAARKRPANLTGGSGTGAFDYPGALDEICDRIEGGETMAAIAASKGVHRSQLTRWVAAKADRRERVDMARMMSAEALSEMAMDKIINAKGSEGLTRARELAHHLRWLARMRDPKRFGDRVVQEHVGDGGGPVKTEAVVNVEAGEAYLRLINGSA
ncbi:hypothetical protein [Pigmentiphaga daeguensis]|uniref:Uncharacterized protein n=1 Tax=Pigmentiphaga daeguensis TaxID=414049 RepID=A0ABN1D2H1_9BURK